MAKKSKNNENLTLEEKLEQALIPNWDEPYKLPDNWCWIKLLFSFDNLTDSKKKIQQKKYLNSGKWAIIDQGQNLVGGYTDDSTMLYNGNLPVIIFGDHTRCIKYIDFHFAQGADGVKVLKPKSFYIPKLFYYAMKSIDIPNLGYRRHFPLFDKYAISLPPLAEQQRIVDRIEIMFSKLDEAKEKAQEVIDGFENRKAAILHKAFSGELTAKWRKKNNVNIIDWKYRVFKDVLDVRDGTHDSPQYYDKGYPLVTSKNLKDGGITNKNIKYISKEDFEQINLRSKVDIGDILFAMIGTIGNPVVVEKEPNYAIKNVALFKNIGLINPYFVKYYLETKKVKDKMAREAKGSTQKFVSLGYLRNFGIISPSEDEQSEIVRILDTVFTEEQQAKEKAEKVLERIELIKKSILARAFRGELGTNNPDEESAVELLKEILSECADNRKKATIKNHNSTL